MGKRTEYCSFCSEVMRINGGRRLTAICKCGSVIDFSSRVEDQLYEDLQ